MSSGSREDTAESMPKHHRLRVQAFCFLNTWCSGAVCLFCLLLELLLQDFLAVFASLGSVTWSCRNVSAPQGA